MNYPITEFLNRAGRYTEKEVLLLKKELQFRMLKKEEVLLNKGDICSSLCFIIKGAIYQYNIDSEFNKNVIDLNVSNDWILNHKSFTTQKPSEYFIQSYEESTICVLSIESIHRLIAQSQSLLQMGKILEASISRIDFFDNNYTPDEKYQYLLKNKPELIQKFPQKLIASYLKITPETISRVRHRLSKHKCFLDFNQV